MPSPFLLALALPAGALLAAHQHRPAPFRHGAGLTRLCPCRASPVRAVEAALPRDIKEVINQLRGSVQAGLQARMSRMDVDLPIGAEFGVEGGEKRKRGTFTTADDIAKSDREVARLFVEMFAGTGLVPLVLFSDAAKAKRAKELWPGVEARVAALGRPAPPSPKPKKAAKKRSGGGGGGFGGGGFGGAAAPPPSAAPRVLSAVPPATEVLFAVRPGPEQLDAIQQFSETSGMDRLVILINARVNTLENCYFANAFENCYTFVTDPTGAGAAQAQSKDGSGSAAAAAVLWRAYPDDWVLATKPKLGPPKQIAALSSRPSQEAIETALDEAASPGGLLDSIGLGGVF